MKIRHKGAPVSGDRDCILQYFSKKGCGVSKVFNFSIVLDLNLVITNESYQDVLLHQGQEPDVLETRGPKVSGHLE